MLKRHRIRYFNRCAAFLVTLTFITSLFGCNEEHSLPELQGRALIKIWENGNIQDLDKIMTHDAIYEAAQREYSYKGIEEVGRYVGHLKLFAKDLKIKVISVRSTETTAVLEWIMSGIQHRPIPGSISVATNKEFNVKGITIVEIKDGLISKAIDYMDVLGFVIQLGARIELPGGVVLESK